ncbi:heme ABC transporter ATP-binding protein [Agrobacterium rosae]|uniref:Heme ABC transporter ATP-binding protein n=1 Tax=Agrobacterium rosae TaxID=1972867 RepID=A0AAW9FFR6_9HYPH|nr:heme ABC transporter ATP-binding protein [Agrobacterium rosae]MDX8301780.1 heme ABC transporter ATP-binding protein [Agrobacterium rosae]POO54945.1 heme ABC transporter ATP-binding protein [Agrobacterium rosae]
MISTRGVTVVRSGRKLLDDVSIKLEPATFSVIIGPNGAGKSTLMKVLSGEMRADAGDIAYNTIDVKLFSPVQLARIRAVLPQSTVLSFPFTALEIVRMGAVAQGSLKPEEQARQALAKLGLSGFEGRSYNMLSGGEQQRVQFARVLAQVPYPVEDGQARALLLDEPTSSLDLGHQISVLETARDFALAGGTVLAVLHDLNLAAEFADQLIVMHRGKITACGPALETINDETIARVYGIGGTVGRVPARHIPYVLPQSRHR